MTRGSELSTLPVSRTVQLSTHTVYAFCSDGIADTGPGARERVSWPGCATVISRERIRPCGGPCTFLLVGNRGKIGPDQRRFAWDVPHRVGPVPTVWDVACPKQMWDDSDLSARGSSHATSLGATHHRTHARPTPSWDVPHKPGPTQIFSGC